MLREIVLAKRLPPGAEILSNLVVCASAALLIRMSGTPGAVKSPAAAAGSTGGTV
jgi:hypothetical protein